MYENAFTKTKLTSFSTYQYRLFNSSKAVNALMRRMTAVAKLDRKPSLSTSTSGASIRRGERNLSGKVRFIRGGIFKSRRVSSSVTSRRILSRRCSISTVLKSKSFKNDGKSLISTSSSSSSSIVSNSTTIRHASTYNPIKLFLQNLRHRVHKSLLEPRTIPIPRWITPKHNSITLSECFGHASFILVAVSYSTDDFILLRSIAVAGSGAMLLFTYFHPHGRVLWLPLKWNVLFMLINGWRIGVSFYEKHCAEMFLSDDLRRIRDDHFYVVDPVDFWKLVSIATEDTYENESLVVGQGQMNRYIRMCVEGELDILRDGIRTYTIQEGNFISEAGLHSGLLLSGKIESCCSIVAKPFSSKNSRVRVLRWDRTELMELLNKETSLRRSLKAALSWDIVRKLKGQRHSISKHEVDAVGIELWTRKRNEQNEDRYASILQNLLHHSQDFEGKRVQLENYKHIHQIDNEHHRMALRKCGWTLAEYEAGKRDACKNIEQDHDGDYDGYGQNRGILHQLRGNIIRILSGVLG